MQSGFSDQNTMNLVINDIRKSEKFTNMCKLIKYSNKQWVEKEEITKEIRKHINMNKNKNTKDKNLRDLTAAELSTNNKKDFKSLAQPST